MMAETMVRRKDTSPSPSLKRATGPFPLRAARREGQQPAGGQLARLTLKVLCDTEFSNELNRNPPAQEKRMSIPGSTP